MTSNTRLKVASDSQANAIKNNFPPGIAKPALRALASAGMTKLENLTEISEQDLSNLHGMGPKATGILIAGLNEKGLKMRT